MLAPSNYLKVHSQENGILSLTLDDQVEQRLNTAAVDNLLCMNFWVTQWTMVTYLKNQIKIEVQKRTNILGAIYDLPANQHSQSGPISLKKGCADQLVDLLKSETIFH